MKARTLTLPLLGACLALVCACDGSAEMQTSTSTESSETDPDSDSESDTDADPDTDSDTGAPSSSYPCAEAEAAGCPSGLEFDACVELHAFTEPACAEPLASFLACYEQQPGFECVAGAPAPPACVDEDIALDACAHIEFTCRALEAAACSRAIPYEICVEATSTVHSARYDGCAAEYNAYWACFGEFTCSPEGSPVPTGCEVQFDTLQNCINLLPP